MKREDFNQYGARRGHDDVMVRGTFANIRLRNLLVPGVEGGVTRHLPDGEQMAIFDASVRYKQEGVPLVVQLSGRDCGPLVEAAHAAQEAGAVHLNLNMGCPYGRMNVGCGGGMLERPQELPGILAALRAAIAGTFSVKVRAGYDDPEQIFSLLPLFEAAGVDFLVLHARTVVQRYDGSADHGVTARVVRQTRLPVIANGDICTAADGARVLKETGAAGLMLGRGAMRDPLLFERLRGRAPAEPSSEGLLGAQQQYLRRLAQRWGALFGADAQVLAKLKGALALMELPEESRAHRALRKAKTVDAFCEAIEALGDEPSAWMQTA